MNTSLRCWTTRHSVDLSVSAAGVVRRHSQNCVTCDGLTGRAQSVERGIKERVQAVVEPSPFFQTKVMAALREQQALESVPAWLRLWRSAGALVSSMAVATVALAALSFVVPSATNLNKPRPAYSAESVLFDQGNDEQLSYEQVLSTIYAEDEAK